MNEEINDENQIKEDFYSQPTTIDQKNCNKKLLPILNIIILIGLIILYVLFFTTNKTNKEETTITNQNSLSIAYINSDTLWGNYEFVNVIKEKLKNTEITMQSQYDAQVYSLKKDYDEYVKKGTAGLLSLNQQKKTEEQLSKRQKRLVELDEKLSTQLLDEKQKLNTMLQDSIINYIKRYNKKTNFTYILEYSKISSVLFANDSFNITKDILNGLNEEYKNAKAKNE